MWDYQNILSLAFYLYKFKRVHTISTMSKNNCYVILIKLDRKGNIYN